jgi:hypothetical protein
VSVSRAKDLLSEAARQPTRLDRALTVAAALREVLRTEPVVVGGTAQDLYTGETYRETDLDLVASVTPDEKHLLVSQLGFTQEPGRHLYHEPSRVAVEFPESTLAGDESRIWRQIVAGSTVAVIGLDDLYLDRIHQATASSTKTDEDSSEQSALAIALAQYDQLDWGYIRAQIKNERVTSRTLGDSMDRINKRVRRKMLYQLRQP